MSWREDYETGSFRGAPFRTERHNRSGGRRAPITEYPGRDEPMSEDLGRRFRAFTLEFHVIGEDYRAERDALIDALEEEGPGLLIHPWHGQMMVVVHEYQQSEDVEEGGMARFSVDFAESGAPVSAPIAVPSGEQTAAEAAGLKDAIPAEFAKRFSVDKLAGFVEQAAGDIIGGIADISQIAAGIQGGIGPTLRAFETGLRLLPGNLSSLLHSPINLARSVIGLVSAVSALGANNSARFAAPTAQVYGTVDWSAPRAPAVGPATNVATRNRIAALTLMLDWTPPPPSIPVMTTTRAQQVENRYALLWLFRTACSIELTRVAAAATYASYEDAIATRDAISERLDRFALEAADRGDDIAVDGFDRLRRAVVRDISARGENLARIYEVEIAATEPALVIANRVYGASGVADRADQIVGRNRIRHPGFVPGGKAVRLLTDTVTRAAL